ncbi:MAG: hypothetical protein OZSIB_1850 [Candidatus Ozemobacter sibiricus]|jgi:Ca-activated chloride channel family protein|uniref:VWFA domain-containing protein n=1 Tax=Candidatus Ozemobacter sibiricus TaxID=2268124 RepID=A0A367ZIW9_9BACT|nr:MAG: hypothetical protein OZSIB_1850 [Candidatus Ozemobacter sibiricus]
MNKLRLVLLVILTANLALIAWDLYGAHLTGLFRPTDDWLFHTELEPRPVRDGPWVILALWLCLEFIRVMLMGGMIASFLVVIVIMAVLASVSGPMIGSITDQGWMSAERAQRANDLALSVGGAKDVNAFRRNLQKGYLPSPTDVTFEGLYYDYTFDTGKGRAAPPETAGGAKRLFYPTYTTAVTTHPLTGEVERYLAVGLNSDLTAADFQRKKLNLLVVLDISGSMSSPFDRYYYDRFTGRRLENKRYDTDQSLSKLEVACRSIVDLLDHLRPDDRFGMVLFDHQAYLAKSLRLVSATDMPAIRQHILALRPQGCTNMEAGLTMGIELLAPYANADPEEWENRIIFLTDAMPNTDDTSEEGLLGLTRAASQRRIYVSFVGIGLDFTSELIESITKVRGANYCAVFSNDQFRQKLVEEFEFMVTPLLFDLTLQVKADGYVIEKVYGSPEANEATGELMRVNTLFPTRTVGGEAKGGLVLLKVRQIGPSPHLTLEARCLDRAGRTVTNRTAVTFPTGEGERFDTTGIRKGVLLARYGQLVKDWLSAARQSRAGLMAAEQRRAGLGLWERPSQPLTVDAPWGDLIRSFLAHFRQEADVIGDPALARETQVLETLATWPGQQGG